MDKELNEAIEELKSIKGPYTYSDCEVCDEDCDKCIKNKAIDTVLNRLEEYENQLDLDYVDENYIPKKRIEDIVSRLKISDIEPWNTYKISGDILFDLQELLDTKK